MAVRFKQIRLLRENQIVSAGRAAPVKIMDDEDLHRLFSLSVRSSGSVSADARPGCFPAGAAVKTHCIRA